MHNTNLLKTTRFLSRYFTAIYPVAICNGCRGSFIQTSYAKHLQFSQDLRCRDIYHEVYRYLPEGDDTDDNTEDINLRKFEGDHCGLYDEEDFDWESDEEKEGDRDSEKEDKYHDGSESDDDDEEEEKDKIEKDEERNIV